MRGVANPKTSLQPIVILLYILENRVYRGIWKSSAPSLDAVQSDSYNFMDVPDSTTIIDMGYNVIEHLLNSIGSDIKVIKSRHNSFTKEYSHLATMLNDPTKYTNDIQNIYQKLKNNSENSTIAPEPKKPKIENK